MNEWKIDEGRPLKPKNEMLDKLWRETYKKLNARYVTNYLEDENKWEVYIISDAGIIGKFADERRLYNSYTEARAAIKELEKELCLD